MADEDRRGVFISWSKPVASEIAAHLKPFLEDVLGTATIFMSAAMEGGTRWGTEIPERLAACNAGLVIVTAENTHEPWLHFEAGALSKHVDEARVVPLLCGASVGDLQGTPLAMFQAKSLNHEEFLDVCLSFGRAFGIGDDAVRRRFDKGWAELEAAVANVSGRRTPARQLGFPDLMAVLERLSSQISTIETNTRLGASAAVGHILPNGMFASRQNYLGSNLVEIAAEGDPEREFLEAWHRSRRRSRLKGTEGTGTVDPIDDEDGAND